MKFTESDKEKCRQPRRWGYSSRNTAEREEYAKAHGSPRMNETDTTNTCKQRGGLLEQILSNENLQQAYKRVVRNKGAGGVDGMQVDELLPWLKIHQKELLQSLREGTYRPQPVRRVEIPKENGKTRKLGIPTVVDRLVQQAIHQVLSPTYEKQFSESSYGFRPKRGAHTALRQCQNNITEGYIYVVDLDLERYFDTVNQSKLIQLLSETIKDGRVISLIHKFLLAGILDGEMFEESKDGVPQGGPLSPLLGNIILHECDRELEQRGHRFVRYADDLMVFCKSTKAAQRTLDKLIPFIEGKLFLKVNREKTKVAKVQTVKFLGYGFYMHKGTGRLKTHKKSVDKLKAKLREITGRSNGMGIQERKEKLNNLIRGWVQYFHLADMKSLLLKELDPWLRRRLRMVAWKRWKKVKTRHKMLRKLGIPDNQAWQWSNTRKSYWRTAGSPILTQVMSNEKLRGAGYLTLADCYCKVMCKV